LGDVAIADRRPLRTFLGSNPSVEAVDTTPNPVPSLAVDVDEVCVGDTSKGESVNSSSSISSFPPFKLRVGEHEKNAYGMLVLLLSGNRVARSFPLAITASTLQATEQ
jgi:hypothetical protein